MECFKVERGSRGTSQKDEAIPRLVISPRSQYYALACQALVSADRRQIPYVGFHWRAIVEGIGHTALDHNEPGPAIDPVRSSILRLDPRSTTFTSAHLLFASLCLRARAYRAALSILDHAVVAFPPRPKPRPFAIPELLSSLPHITYESGVTDRITSQDIMEYHLCGISIYIFLRQWTRALDFAQIVLNHPIIGQEASMIMVEAFKKWILVSLLKHGHAGDIPERTQNPALNSMRVTTRAYAAVAHAFRERNIMRFEAELIEGQEIWAYDRNQGLIRMVKAAFYKNRIRHLENIFRTLTVHEIRERALVPADFCPVKTDHDTEDLLRQMIADGELCATIENVQNGPAVVTFDATMAPVDDAAAEAKVLERIEDQQAALQELTDQMQQMDANFSLSHEWATYLKKEKKMKGHGAGNYEGDLSMSGQASGGFDPTLISFEEDLMLDDNWLLQ